ncbi:hypothetical protein ACHAWT_001520 [Skeletonema menzelii]
MNTSLIIDNMPSASSLGGCSDDRTCRRRRASSPESEHISCNCNLAINNCCPVDDYNIGCIDESMVGIELPPIPLLQSISSSSREIKLRRRRHGSKSNLCSQIVLATTALALMLISSPATISNTDGPSLLFASAFSAPPLTPMKQLSPSCYTKTTATQHYAVRKRVGSHHQPTNQNYIAAPPRTAPSTTNSVAPRRRKNNVFEQFTPDYIASPYDVDLGPSAVDKNGHVELSHKDDTKTNNGTSKPRRRGRPSKNQSTTSAVDTNGIKNANKVNLRLQSLLLNDEGEINPYLPDDSPEAAQQLAQFHTYSKVSEEARRKAKESVSSHADDEDEQDDDEGGRVVATTRNIHNLHDTSAVAAQRRNASNKRRMSIRATVKETGSDSISSYTKSLGQHELLHKDDEVLLGRQVRMLMILEEKRMELEEELLRPPTFAQWAAATNHTVPSLKQQIRRSQRAKAALIEANLRLVITVARQAVKKSPFASKAESNSVQFQDACQQGIIGLTRATEKFDPELGFRFSTYAIWWIQKEVTKNVSEQSRAMRVPASAIKRINDIRIQERVLMTQLGRRPNDEEVAEKVGMSVEKLNFYRQSAKGVSSLDKTIDARKGKGSNSSGGGTDGTTMDNFVKDTDQPSPSELIDQQMLKEDIKRLVKTLSPREQAVIRLRFGLDDGKPQTLGDISAKFGVEKEKVKKIETRALLKLRQPSRSSVVRCYVSDHT